MTLDTAMQELEALGSEKGRRMNSNHGVVGHQFGARLGDIRKIAARIKTDDDLASSLWKTGNHEARRTVVRSGLAERKKTPDIICS